MNRSMNHLGLLIALLAGAPGTSGGQERDPAHPSRAAARADEAFGFDLYARLRDTEGNLLFSPQSLSVGLALAHAGARGETGRQMATTLHLPNDRNAPHPSLAVLPGNPKPDGEDKGCQLRSAHALWGQQGIGIREEYAKTLKERFGSGLHVVDFLGDTPRACRSIDTWAEEQTRGKVKNLLRPSLVTPRTRLVLTDVLYFKGIWTSAFSKGLTRMASFDKGKGRTVVVPFMHQSGYFPYLDQDGLQILELPYHDGDFSMVVLLPRQADGLAALEKGLSASRLSGWVARLRPRKVDVALPRFRISAELELKQALSALGMPLAFDEARADFSGMLEGGEPLYLSEVVHKAFVDVNEEGTESAAATGATLKARSLPADRPVFRADHSFVFLIRDRRSGRMLVLGRLADPDGGPSGPLPGDGGDERGTVNDRRDFKIEKSNGGPTSSTSRP